MSPSSTLFTSLLNGVKGILQGCSYVHLCRFVFFLLLTVHLQLQELLLSLSKICPVLQSSPWSSVSAPIFHFVWICPYLRTNIILTKISILTTYYDNLFPSIINADATDHHAANLIHFTEKALSLHDTCYKFSFDFSVQKMPSLSPNVLLNFANMEHHHTIVTSRGLLL